MYDSDRMVDLGIRRPTTKDTPPAYVGGVATEYVQEITEIHATEIATAIVKAMGRKKKLPKEIAEKFDGNVIREGMTRSEIIKAVQGISDSSRSRYLQIARSLEMPKK